MQLFVEEKIDAYKLEHPDMEDEDVQSKLRRKYVKLSDKKTVIFIVICSKQGNDLGTNTKLNVGGRHR